MTRLNAIVHKTHVPLFQGAPEAVRNRIRCMSFTRWGGVSAPPFNELNLGGNVGDAPESVTANRLRVQRILGADVLVRGDQVHADHLAVVEGSEESGAAIAATDGLLTDCRRVGLLIQQADCQAVVLYDPRRHAVANVHCGWRGNAANILGKTVKRMVRVFGSAPGDLWAAISPSLGPCCGEFKDWRSLLPVDLHTFQPRADFFDFWAVSVHQLRKAGLNPVHIEVAGICTVCSDDFFSHRREGRTGRCGTAVVLL